MAAKMNIKIGITRTSMMIINDDNQCCKVECSLDIIYIYVIMLFYFCSLYSSFHCGCCHEFCVFCTVKDCCINGGSRKKADTHSLPKRKNRNVVEKLSMSLDIQEIREIDIY